MVWSTNPATTEPSSSRCRSLLLKNRRKAGKGAAIAPYPSPLHVILLSEVVADLHQHRDAFGIAGFCNRRLAGLGAEFPTVAVADHGNYHAIRTIGVNLQFRHGHHNEFGLALAGFTHRDGFLPLLLRRRL